jgi:LAS superfamily LD-carboxypeptidase LdcB
MDRIAFIKTSVLSAFGSRILINSEFLKVVEFQKVSKENLLGLSPSHLKSDSILLEKETYDSFSLMKTAALKDNIHLKVVSGYRSYNQQKAIWERKYNYLITKELKPLEAISEIITYSSVPGTSRHHWGTDVDLIDSLAEMPEGDLLLEENYQGNAFFSKMNSWMNSYASDFGFEMVYTQDAHRTGFNYEPWHYSFSPKAKSFLKVQLEEDYRDAWNMLDFKGKSEMTTHIVDDYFKNYVLGINPNLMPS